MSNPIFEKRALFEICEFSSEEEAWESLDQTFGETMTHDKFCATMLIDKLTARLMLELTLDPSLLVQLDLSTLEIKRTRIVDSEGKECVGDLFFTVKYVDKPGRNGRCAIFALIVEHKSDEDFYISIQLLGYVWAWLDFMKDHKKEYADEEGRLPVPYVLVFSQDWRESPPKYLSDVTFCADGCENTVPNFWYRCVRVRDIPFDEIRRCEPLLQGFLYLEQLAKNKKITPEQELDDLAQIFGDLCDISFPNERIQRGIVACMNYLTALSKFRPQTTTLSRLFNRIEQRGNKTMDVSFLEEAFPSQLKLYVASYQEKIEQRDRDIEQRDRDMQNSKKFFLNLVSQKFETVPSKKLIDKIQSVNSTEVFLRIQDLLQRFDSIEEFENKLDEVV